MEFIIKKTSFVLASALFLTAGSALADGADDFILQNRTPAAGALSQAQVQQDLAAARRSGELATIGAEAGYGVTAKPVVSIRNRAEMEAEAVSAAHAPNQNLDPKAFVGSRIPDSLNGWNKPVQAAVDVRRPL